jgi:hypothetical protein
MIIALTLLVEVYGTPPIPKPAPERTPRQFTLSQPQYIPGSTTFCTRKQCVRPEWPVIRVQPPRPASHYEPPYDYDY